ncbi:uncharacterized protein B0H18DRAFT_1026807 [Fomitopsis serialis]|uniref:uncharacterized protein n=1 Tax=Fomitopsis serialis TaxID=139415 RepID=UPI002007BD03|nr:uncharacterized protein B0H18DRAFT_1026807 [Neoantrodia serialis]KAH9919710.1 hypothetical protein B0H18DRAFT_1026807 [Neoantrodia serialis]
MSATRHLYVFTAPYKTEDPEAMKRRAQHRPAHVQRLTGMWDDGTVQLGGPMLSSDSNPAGPPSDLKAISSFIIFRAESIEKVREIVESDLFYTEDIWVKEEIRINPILAAGPALK